MKKRSVRQIAQFLGLILDSETPVLGFQIDSRKVEPGHLFFALRGECVDGHRFLSEVKGRGGIAAVVSKDYQGPDFGLELLRVESVFSSLHQLGKEAALQMRSKIVGITGSVGKTTTKEFSASLLAKKFRVGKSEASCNSKLTFPLTLLNFDADLEVLVLEMGMSESGDITRLLQVAAPDIAVITKVGLAHSEFFEDGLEGIAKAKAEIFQNERTKTAIFDHAFYQFGDLVQQIQAKKVSFSLKERDADYFLSALENRYVIDERGVRSYQFDLPFKESHILHDFLAAVAVARALGMEWDEIRQGVADLKLPKMRFEQFVKNDVHFINDAYNANPESMRAALSNLPEPKVGGKCIAVLATMKELGKLSEESHLEIGRFAQKYADHLLVLGEEAKPLCEGFSEVKKPAEHFADHKQLAARLSELMSPGDVVLLKGSRSMELERIIEGIEERNASAVS